MRELNIKKPNTFELFEICEFGPMPMKYIYVDYFIKELSNSLILLNNEQSSFLSYSRVRFME